MVKMKLKSSLRRSIETGFRRIARLDDSALFKILYISGTAALALFVLKTETSAIGPKWEIDLPNRFRRSSYITDMLDGEIPESLYEKHIYQHDNFGAYQHQEYIPEDQSENPDIYNITEHTWYKMLEDLDIPETEWEEFQYELSLADGEEDENLHENEFEGDVSEFESEESELKDQIKKDGWIAAANEHGEAGIPDIYKSLGLSGYAGSPDEPFIMEEDVRIYQRKKKNRSNIKRFKFGDIEFLHDKFLAAFERRFESAMDDLEIAEKTPKPADEIPFEILSKNDKAKRNIPFDATSYPNFKKDAGLWSPIISDVFGFENYQRENIFKTGKTHIVYIFPESMPLNVADPKDHVDSYKNYFNFFSSMRSYWDNVKGQNQKIILSAGRYLQNLNFIIKKVAYRTKKFNWNRYANAMIRPRASTMQGSGENVFATLSNFIFNHNIESTANEGEDCFIIMVHHDTLSDIASMDEVLKTVNDRNYLNAACTMMHIFVGFKGKGEQLKQYMTVFNPHLSEKIVYDQKFKGYWNIDHPSDMNEDLQEQVLDYIALTKYRQSCKVVTNGYVNNTLTLEDESRNDEYSEEILDYYGDENEEPEYYEENSDAALASAVPLAEQLSCCGHSQWTAKAYNTNEKACCSGILKDWGEDGEDPCKTINDRL